LARHFLEIWSRGADGGLAILLRTAATNDSAAERVREIFRGQVLPMVASVAPDAAPARAALIATQILGMAYCRFVVRIPELAAMDEDVVVRSLGQTLQRYLHDSSGKT
jgi:hypothetical protein